MYKPRLREGLKKLVENSAKEVEKGGRVSGRRFSTKKHRKKIIWAKNTRDYLNIFLCRTYFLAAMRSSRSDIVTQSVRSCFRPLFFLLVSLKFLLALKSFNSVSRQFKKCLNLMEVSRKF